MATTITLNVDEADVKRGMEAAAKAVEPLKTSFTGAERAAEKLKITALASFHEIEQQARNLANADLARVNAEFERMEEISGRGSWGKFVNELLAEEQSLQRVGAATRSLTASKAAYSAAGKAFANTSQLSIQASYALQDALAGGATGGIKGAALGASNNLAAMAATLGGPWGIAIGAAITALPLVIGLFQSYGKEAEEDAESTETFTEKLNAMADAQSRMKEIGALTDSGAGKELANLEKRQKLVWKIIDDQTTSDKNRDEAYEEFLRLQEEIDKVAERQVDARHSENAALQKNREELARQLGYSREASGVLDDQLNAEREAYEERLSYAKNAGDTKEVAEAHREVSSELNNQVDRLKKLREELYKTKDATKAAGLVKEMDEASRRIKKAQENLKDLDNQMARAEGAEKRAKREKDILDKQLADEKDKRDQAAKEMEDAAVEAAQRLKEALAGNGGAADQVIGGAKDPKAIARQLAEQAADQARRKALGSNQDYSAAQNAMLDWTASGNVGPGPFAAQKTIQQEEAKARDAADKARRKAFRQAMNQLNGGPEVFSQNQIAGAVQQNAQGQINALQKTGDVGDSAVQALSQVVRVQLQAEQRAQQQQDAIDRLMQFTIYKPNTGRGRRTMNNP